MNADVGAMKMKTWLTLMALVLSVGCASHPHASDNTTRRPPHDLRFWQVMTATHVRTQFGGNPDISKELADIIIKKAANDLSPVNLTIHLCRGVAVSNTYWLQEMAENHGITNITVKITQAAPQRTQAENGKLQQGVPPYGAQGAAGER